MKTSVNDQNEPGMIDRGSNSKHDQNQEHNWKKKPN